MAPKMLLLVLAASLALAAPHAYAVKAIDGFTPGLLTFYGGAPDGMDASAPSYGTKEVRRQPACPVVQPPAR